LIDFTRLKQVCGRFTSSFRERNSPWIYDLFVTMISDNFT